ncbi:MULTISPECIES: hypothetical protein [Gordonia]|uniref:hypothetical protein n=1 Tax=Gordonia TaxID=2053 RepID=UPI0033917CA2
MIPHVLYEPALFHACALLNLLIVSGAWCLARPSYRAAVVLGVLSVTWLFFNHPLEGNVLIAFSPDRGLTESDVLSFIAFAIVGVVLIRLRARRS